MPEPELKLFEDGERTTEKQATHTVDTVQLLGLDLKNTLVNMALSLFGKGMSWSMLYSGHNFIILIAPRKGISLSI